MNIVRVLATLTAGLLCCATLPSCESDEEGAGYYVNMPFTDIATYEGNTAPGGGATMTVCKDGDLPPATLYCRNVSVPENIKPGTRMLIRYTNESNEPYTSGAATLLGAQTVTQGDVDLLMEPTWDATRVYLLSVWRTGSYLNFRVRLPYSTEPRIFKLTADPATILSPRPQLYLAHDLAPAEADGHDREYYASFNMAAVWNLAGTEGVVLHVNNSNLDKQIFTFDKTPAH